MTFKDYKKREAAIAKARDFRARWAALTVDRRTRWSLSSGELQNIIDAGDEIVGELLGVIDALLVDEKE